MGQSFASFCFIYSIIVIVVFIVLSRRLSFCSSTYSKKAILLYNKHPNQRGGAYWTKYTWDIGCCLKKVFLREMTDFSLCIFLFHSFIYLFIYYIKYIRQNRLPFIVYWLEKFLILFSIELLCTFYQNKLILDNRYYCFRCVSSAKWEVRNSRVTKSSN